MTRSTRTVAVCLASVLAAGMLAGFGGGLQSPPTGDVVAVIDAAETAPAPVESPPDSPRTLADIRDRPDLLADRRLPTVDLLPPPADDRFAASVGPVTDEVRARMGESWSEGCPVGLAELRHLRLVFRGFDGRAHTGELVVNAAAAEVVVGVFRSLFEADFPIEEMRLITTADHQAPPTGDGNVTAGYNCRTARGQKRWSAHAYGMSVDINPFQNPMVRRGTVIPELASAYVDRGLVRPGMLLDDGPAVRAFTAAGWQWGGHWQYSKDYMHFSSDGS